MILHSEDHVVFACHGDQLLDALHSVAGISLPRLSEDQFRCGDLVSFNELRPGDLVFFISLSQRIIDHVGIYLGDTQFVHASAPKGVVLSSLRQDYYAKRFHGAKRIIQ